MTRPTLRELARERGLRLHVSGKSTPASWWTMHAEAAYFPDSVVVDAPTRNAASAGLRAALLAIPIRKEKKR